MKYFLILFLQEYNYFVSYVDSAGMSDLKVCRSAGLQLYKYVDLRVCKSAGLQVCRSAGLQV